MSPRPATKNAFDQAMLALARIHVDKGLTVRNALHTVARVAVTALGVARFSVWLTTEERDAVRLYFLHRPDEGDVLDGTILRLEQFPAYFKALGNSRALLVPDVSSDPAVAELLDGYLRPLGIGAMLDAPIYRAGAFVGVVCHEHIGGPRVWENAEREFAADVASAVARLFEEGDRVQAEDSLRIYQRHLRELSRYEGMGRLAAGVAHDLRNLLHVVSANAELAASRTTDPEMLESLHAVIEAVKRSRELTGTVLRFGSNSLEGPMVLDPAALVCDCEGLLRGAMDIHELTVDVHDSHSRVLVVKAELERVLLNLVTNAREAMGDTRGKVSITVRDIAATDNDSGGQVAIVVQDNGSGMSPDTLLQIRRPFFTTKKNGTGLGLAMADQILARAGGMLQVDSVEGEGTTVTCVLPRIA